MFLSLPCPAATVSPILILLPSLALLVPLPSRTCLIDWCRWRCSSSTPWRWTCSLSSCTSTSCFDESIRFRWRLYSFLRASATRLLLSFPFTSAAFPSEVQDANRATSITHYISKLPTDSTLLLQYYIFMNVISIGRQGGGGRGGVRPPRRPKNCPPPSDKPLFTENPPSRDFSFYPPPSTLSWDRQICNFFLIKRWNF